MEKPKPFGTIIKCRPATVYSATEMDAYLADLEARMDAKDREIQALRLYGNKDCTAMADVALADKEATDGKA